MVSQFSSDATAVLDREIKLEEEKGNPVKDISSYYELSRCSEWIKLGRFRKVGANTIHELIAWYGGYVFNYTRMLIRKYF